MKRRHMVFSVFAIVGLILVTSCATAPKNKATGNKELDRLLEKAKMNQETLTFNGDAFNDDNTFSLVNTHGKYNLVLPFKDCLFDIKCGPTCDPAVKTGHSGDHLWLYLKKNGIPYTLDPNDWNKTTISVVEGLISKGIPVAYTETPSIAQKERSSGNKELDRLLKRAENNQETLTFYGDAYNEDNTFSLVKTNNGQYNLILPLKDCFLDIKCNAACDPAVKTGHSGNHLWFYLQKNGIPYELDRNDWNKTMISVVDGLIAHGIPVTYTGK